MSDHDQHDHNHGQHHHNHRRDDQDSSIAQAVDHVAFWEEFYAGGHGPWSGRPNRILVEELTARPLSPGSVLDLGSGSGADAVWFAEHGWTVTGVDISAAALAIATEVARNAGVGDRITWLARDLETAFPDGRWDLVVASYLHSPVAFERQRVLLRAGDAVDPGGTLLILGHETFPAWRQHPERLPALDEVLDAFTSDAWETVRAESVGFPMPSPEGEPGERTDHVIRLRRL